MERDIAFDLFWFWKVRSSQVENNLTFLLYAVIVISFHMLGWAYGKVNRCTQQS
jgi:hypothetical protein